MLSLDSYEGDNPCGSHKPNTAVPQAYSNKLARTKRLATETGAGQWGSSLSMACRLFGLDCRVYMVKVSYHQKPYRRLLMHTWGAVVHASPSHYTDYGKQVLEKDPECPGSLGIAISEAIEDTVKHPGTKYALGSVLNHVCLHQIGDTAQTTPLLWMYTLGNEYIPPQIHAGGLRYHGMAPTVSHLYKLGLIEAVAYQQTKVFEAAVQFAQTEGIVPAPESSHAVRAAIDAAIAAREEGRKRVILFNLSGHGLLDLASYEAYLAGKLRD